MNQKLHLLCAWGGVVFVVFFGWGWALLGGYIPPPSPNATALEIAGFYQANTGGIRLGLIAVMLGIAALVPFMAELTLLMSDIEGRRPVLAIGNVIAGTINTLLFVIPVVLWAVASFRPERDAELIRLLNDIGWMFILWPFSPAALQNILIGTCILLDRRPHPVFPRWIGFLNFWVAILLIPGGLLVCFKAGPFAWNGLLAFWLPATIYLFWLTFMTAAMRKAIISSAAG
jgi:hypothetical protein